MRREGKGCRVQQESAGGRSGEGGGGGGGGGMVRTMASVLPKASIDNGNGKCRNNLRGIRFSRISNMKKWKLRKCGRWAVDFCEEREEGEGKGKK
jgi:hypothetical protein